MATPDLPPRSLGASAAAAAAHSALAIDLRSPARHFGAGVDLSDWMESGTFDTQRVALDWWQIPSLSPMGTQRLVIADARRPIVAAAVAAAGARNVTAQLVVESSDASNSTRQQITARLRDVPVGRLPDDSDPRYAGLLKHLAANPGPVKVRARAIGNDRDGWDLVLFARPAPFDPRTEFVGGARSTVVTDAIDRDLPEPLRLGRDLPATLGVDAGASRVTVSLGTRCVGSLDELDSAAYLPLVRSALTRGLSPTCRGVAMRRADGAVEFGVSLIAQPDELDDICDPAR